MLLISVMLCIIKSNNEFANNRIHICHYWNQSQFHKIIIGINTRHNSRTENNSRVFMIQNANFTKIVVTLACYSISSITICSPCRFSVLYIYEMFWSVGNVNFWMKFDILSSRNIVVLEKNVAKIQHNLVKKWRYEFDSHK